MAKRYASGTPVDPLTQKLRAMFDDVLAEPLPPDLLNLLSRLDRKSAEPVGTGGNETDRDG